MAARVLLVMILLIHPARGALSLGFETCQDQRTSCANVSGGVCCPLCDMLDECPCAASEPSPQPSIPVVASDARELFRVVSGVDQPSLSSARVLRAAPRLAPAISLRSMDATVSRFLSKVCLWTT
ncbi:MAG: hypothetical protein AAGA55_10335 [Planctomycetota bacterium]